MSYPRLPMLVRLLFAAGLFILIGTSATFAVSNSVTIDLSGLTLKDGLDQTRSSAPATLPPADEYLYSITGTVHGTGALAFPFDLIPAGTSLANLLNSLQEGAGDQLTGTIANPGSALPLVLLDNSFSAATDFISAGATLQATIGANGAVGFTLSDVSLAVFGGSSDSNSVVFEAGTQLTVSVPLGHLEFALPAVSVVENAGSVTLEIKRVGTTQGAVGVHCFTSPTHAADPADFSGIDLIVDFPAGSDSQTVVIPITDNGDSSPPRSFTVQLDHATGGATLGAVSLTTVTIVDDEPVNLKFYAGTYAGLVRTDADGLRALGVVQASLSKGGGFSGTVRLGDQKYSVKGKLSAAGTSGPLALKNAGGAMLSLAIDTQHGSGLVAVLSGGDLGGSSAPLAKAAFSAKSPFARPGTYTVLFDPPAPTIDAPASSFPQASGFATIKIKPTGSVKLAGKFADGSVASGSGALAGAGEWPFFSSLKKHSAAAGLLAIHDAASPNDVSGDVTSIRAALPSGVYPAGFASVLSTSGSIFQKPKSGTRVLNLPDGIIAFTAGNLLNPFSLAATIDPKNKVTFFGGAFANPKVTLATSTGLFTGSFVEPVSDVRLHKFTGAFAGAILQKQKRAAGFFLGISATGGSPESGSVTLE